MNTREQYKVAWRMVRLFEYRRLAPLNEKPLIEEQITELRPQYRLIGGKADIAARKSFVCQDKPIESFIRHDWKPDLLSYQQGYKMPEGYTAAMKSILYGS